MTMFTKCTLFIGTSVLPTAAKNIFYLTCNLILCYIGITYINILYIIISYLQHPKSYYSYKVFV